MPLAETLTNAALRLAEAVARHESERSVESADAVIAAQLAVKEAFIEAGWQPSDRALRQMHADRDLLNQSAGILDRRSTAAGEGETGRQERVAARQPASAVGVRIVHVGGRPRRPRRPLVRWNHALPGFA